MLSRLKGFLGNLQRVQWWEDQLAQFAAHGQQQIDEKEAAVNMMKNMLNEANYSKYEPAADDLVGNRHA